MADVLVLEDAQRIAAVTHPVRAAILAEMRNPTTAAAVARRTGQSRQNAAYHVRELAKVGLVRHAGERPNGNFMEQLYVATASSVLISPRSTWEGEERDRALADQVSLGELVTAGERLQRDAAGLLDRAAFDGADIPSASMATEVRFADETARSAFLRDYLGAMVELTERHGSPDGEPFRVLFTAYPEPGATP
jgi:hypothetical protein